jgi:hypothetical protein
MSIRKDAAKILKEVHRIHTTPNREQEAYQKILPFKSHLSTKSKLKEKLKLDESRVSNALEYLLEKRLIYGKDYSNEFWILRITAKGIDTVEDNKLSIKEFGISLGGLSATFRKK